MPRFSFLLLLLLLRGGFAACQSYPVGETTLTFYDPARSGRAVPVRVLYPAVAAGAGAAVNTSMASYPIVVFGHGYGIPVSDYQPVWQRIVPAGFIMVLPLTESSGTIVPGNLAVDMRFVFDQMQQQENNNQTSLFYHRISGTGAMAGHSMGGGCSMLAAAGNAAVTCVFSFAAAEITPSPTAASPNVTAPLLLFGGSRDCATPANTTQRPMYNAATASCKAFVLLEGANHCQFAAANASCQAIEQSCGGIATIADSTQLNRTAAFLIPFLKWQLSGSPFGASQYAALLNSTGTATVTYRCTTTSVSPAGGASWKVYPNPASKTVTCQLPAGMAAAHSSLQVFDGAGKMVFSRSGLTEHTTISTEGWQSGIYLLCVSADGQRQQMQIAVP